MATKGRIFVIISRMRKLSLNKANYLQKVIKQVNGRTQTQAQVCLIPRLVSSLECPILSLISPACHHADLAPECRTYLIKKERSRC